MRNRLLPSGDLLPVLFSFALAVAGLGSAPISARAAATEEGVALAIVYDTSGSMKETVRTTDGRRAAKYIIANRALEQIVQRIEHFRTNAVPARTIHAGLFIFSGAGAREAIGMGPFDAGKMLDWVKAYKGPNSATPLGATLEQASQALLKSKLSQKHILVITDGINTVGPDPVVVVPRIQKNAQGRDASVFIHFVAFDIDAQVFTPLKKMGVTVVGAADETQLNQQLEFVLEEKILLEKEDKK